jgi:predicted ArsR family transcriptional regulator
MVQSELDFSRGKHNPESKAAHDSIRPTKKTDRLKIWTMIYSAGKAGLTLEQVADRMGRTPSAISGRLTELAEQGMLHRSEQKGITKSGRSCSVWVA